MVKYPYQIHPYMCGTHMTLGFSLGSSLCISLPHNLNHWSYCMDRWVDSYMHMPLLFVLDSNCGTCFGIDKGSTSCHGMVYF
ncbi:signaling peptide TAXIMIN [Trifolium repens]|nr:signaling peptide TAXIMIN [Trifolium repens]